MLRTAGLSLLLGAAALVAVLQLAYLPAGDDAVTAQSLVWNAEPSDSSNSQAEQLQLNESGRGIVDFVHAEFPAQAYSHLHIALDDFTHNTQVTLVWESSESPHEQRKYLLENESRESIWLSTAELRGWSANISNFQLSVLGDPDTSIRIIDFSLSTPGLMPQLRALYSDLAGFVPWNRSSMNSHAGAIKVSSFYPAPLFAGFLLLSLGAYLLLALVRRDRGLNWQSIGLIFLAAWVALDLFWQKRLTDQLAATQASFAGKTTQEKLAVGPDAQLFNFIDLVKPHLEHESSRVFVASSDDYTGLRGAYYLYPRNVFWTLKGNEVPKNQYLRSGDYIVLLDPHSIDYDRSAGTLIAPRGVLNVETLLTERAGNLVRVD